MIHIQFLTKVLDTGNADVFSLYNITEDFFPNHKEEYRFIKSHYDMYGKAPDKYTFFSKFTKFESIVVNEDFPYLINELFNDRNARIIASSYQTIREKVLTNKVNEAIAEFHNTESLLATSSPIEADDFFDDAQKRYNEYIQKTTDLNNYYVKTGFPELDLMIGGWDRREELVTIAARTNQGKSWILFKSAMESVKQGLRVGIYEGEMSASKVGYRMDTFNGHISNSGIIRGDLRIQSAYKSYIDTLRTTYPNGFCKILTPEKIGGLATVSQLRGFIEKYNLDILFVDQHSLLEDERNGKSPVEKASNISKDLKSLQVLKKIPIITVSQQNRSSTKETGVGTEHIAQSDRIAQDSTVIIFFEQDKEQSTLTMTLVKSRDSAHMKKLNYAFDFDKGNFTYLPEDQDGLATSGNNQPYQNAVDEYVMAGDEISPF